MKRSLKICQILYAIFDRTSQFFFKFWINLQCHQNIYSIIFQLWIKESHQSLNFEPCAIVKILQISHVIFESTSQFSIKSFINIQYHHTELLCTFIAQTLHTLCQRQPIKVQIFEIFECSGQNSSDSSCQF